MTINGPAPTILAMFLNTAIDQQARRVHRARGPRAVGRRGGRAIRGVGAAQRARHRAGRHPQGGPGPEHLHLLHRVLPADDGRHPGVVHRPRGAQLLLGVDLAATTSPRPGRTRSASSRSRSPTASPTSRPTSPAGMAIDDFAPNLSFFFSNGMDAEYTVLGRVARRIWAVAMRERYGADERSQKLKYHVQTPAGRCTRRRWTSTTSARRCRRCARSTTTQLAAHQRLRRGRHHADRGSRCAGRWRSR